MDQYSKNGNGGAVTILPLTKTIVGADLTNRQLWLPLPAAIIPIAVAELEKMIRDAGIERVLEATVAVERA